MAWLGAVLIMYCPFSGTEYLRPYGVDASQYILMAQRQFSLLEAPYIMRWLTPWLVRGVRAGSGYRLDWDASWYLVDFLALFGCGLLFDRFLTTVLKLGRYTTTVCVLLLLSNFVYSVFLFRDAFLVDPINNLLWMAAIYCVFSDRIMMFFLIVAIGAMNKEVILFLAPLPALFALLRSRSIRDAQFVRSVATMAGVTLFYAAYRYGVASYFGHDYAIGQTGSMSRQETVVAALNYQKPIWNIYETFRYLWLTFAWALWEIYERQGWRNRFVVSSLYVLLALSLGRFFASDANRVFVMAAPLVIGVSALFFVSADITFNRLLAVALLVYMAVNVSLIEVREYQFVADVVVVVAIVLVKRKPLFDDLSPETAATIVSV